MNDVVHPSPRADLMRWLNYGACAAAAAGVFGVGGAALTLAVGPQDGFGVAEILELMSQLLLAVVLVAYWHISVANQAIGLRKSALGLFGAAILLQLGGLLIADGPMAWWHVALWLALAAAGLLLVLLVWNLEEVEQMAGGQPAAAAAEAKTTPVGAIVAGLAAVALFLLKVGVKVAVRQAVKAFGMELFEMGVMLALLLLAIVCLGWFAVAKLRLPHVLGAWGPLVGWLELALVAGAVLGTGWLATEFVGVGIRAEQAGLADAQLDAEIQSLSEVWVRRAAVGTVVSSTLWAAATAGLLLAYRGRVQAAEG